MSRVFRVVYDNFKNIHKTASVFVNDLRDIGFGPEWTKSPDHLECAYLGIERYVQDKFPDINFFEKKNMIIDILESAIWAYEDEISLHDQDDPKNEQDETTELFIVLLTFPHQEYLGVYSSEKVAYEASLHHHNRFPKIGSRIVMIKDTLDNPKGA